MFRKLLELSGLFDDPLAEARKHVPLVPVRNAKGRVRIAGAVRPVQERLVTAPFTGAPCVAWAATVLREDPLRSTSTEPVWEELLRRCEATSFDVVADDGARARIELTEGVREAPPWRLLPERIVEVLHGTAKLALRIDDVAPRMRPADVPPELAFVLDVRDAVLVFGEARLEVGQRIEVVGDARVARTATGDGYRGGDEITVVHPTLVAVA